MATAQGRIIGTRDLTASRRNEKGQGGEEQRKGYG